jgi:hypothetical protein
MNLHLGIDIGVQGAIAILDESGALVAVTDMPVGSRMIFGFNRETAYDATELRRRG